VTQRMTTRPADHTDSVSAGVPTPSPRARSGVTVRVPLVLGGLSIATFLGILVAVVSGSADTIDLTIHDAAVALRAPALTVIATAVTGLGTFGVLVGVAVIVAAVLLVQSRRLNRPSLMVLGFGAVACMVYLLKIAVARPRPLLTTLIGSPSSDYSFPSGHTSNGTVTWLLAALLLTAGLRLAIRRAVIIAAAVLCVAIGLSRVYLGYHWMSDVLAGWLLASAAVCLAVIIDRQLVSERPTDQSSAEPPAQRGERTV
jgi:membrane-associated phospholipid phosphatase